jgi:dynein heavy chain, axonemal
MSDVTKQLDGLKERGIRVLEKYELLDGFKYQLDRNDFFNKYHLFGYPKVIHDLLQEVRIQNVTKRAEYLEEMNVNQSIFGQNLQALSNEVNNLSQFNDVGKVDSVSTYIQKLKTRLADARKSKELFNSREGLFGKDITTYESLATITKTFEPYCNMWETVNNWIAMEKRWLNDHFLTIDAEDMEKKLDDFTRKLFKSSKIFQINKIEGCNKIATDFLETVREFKKMCPLVVTLRNPGMRQRHWDKINTLLPQLKESPIVAEDPKFNLQTLIDLKIPESAESISKVGEAAGKEFQIEKALNQMREEWEDVMLTIEPYVNMSRFLSHSLTHTHTHTGTEIPELVF